jgi:hypothetical protein
LPAVLVVGTFKPGDEDTFEAQTSGLTGALVVFQREGGNALTGFKIGRTIRQRGFATGVAASIETGHPVADADALGLGDTLRLALLSQVGLSKNADSKSNKHLPAAVEVSTGGSLALRWIPRSPG